jgi:carbamate kinase
MYLGRLLIALGGNAMLRAGQRGTYDEQMENIRISCQRLVELYKEGHTMVITHGNGPQVDNLLIQNECANASIPAQPLHSCVAQTQGQLGFMIQVGLENEFRLRGETIQAISIMTRVLVDSNDQAFAESTKPIGPFFSKEHAKRQMIQGETWINDSNRGWRRVVPSPKPLRILETEAIKKALEHTGIVIAVGGGGVPVIEQDNQLVGIEAVIDKDYASSLLARDLQVDTFIMLTDVTNAKLNLDQPDETDLVNLTVADAERYIAEGQFGIGSMAPKVEAAIDFILAGGKRAIIASLSQVVAAVRGEAGTAITP